MGRFFLRSLAIAATALTPLTIAAPAAQAQTASRALPTTTVSIGRGELVNLPGRLADIFIADDKIADVQVKSPTQIFVMGKKAGETTIYASDAKGNMIWRSLVRVGSNIDSVDQMLKMAMPESDVNVATMNRTVLLTGTVASPEDAQEAQSLVKGFVGDDINVISRLHVATPLQVNLQVKFAEVSRSLVRQMGSNLVTKDNSGGFMFGVQRGRGGTISTPPPGSVYMDPSASLGYPAGTFPKLPYDPIGGKFVSPPSYTFPGNLTGSSTLGMAGKLLGLNILAALDLGEQVGLVSTLSNPNLTALSGETAEFLAGGEFPIPISQGLGSTSIEYRKYGVSLTYTPTVLANGRISLRVKPEVSELSSQGAVVVNGFQIPALTIRRAETSIELGSGQSFMIAGLMSNNVQHAIEKLPGAGDIPILGNLFRSTNFRKGETELVIVVTPYLVNPVDAKDIKLPTDGFRAATMGGQLLGNMESDGVSGADRPKPSGGEAAGGPQIGMATPAPTAPAGPSKGKKTALAAPGFDLN